MAIARVSLESVDSFSGSVKRQEEFTANIKNQLNSTSTELLEKVGTEKEKASRLENRCVTAEPTLSAKIEEANAQLDALYSQLASTPETITETSTDEEGNTVEEEVPNPEYARLQGEISTVQNRLGTMQSLSERLSALRTQVAQQLEILSSASQKIEEIKDAIDTCAASLISLAESANEKLAQIKSKLQDYLSTKLSPPSVSSRGSLGGLFGGFFGRRNNQSQPQSQPNSSQFDTMIRSRDRVEQPTRTWEDELGGHNMFYGVGGKHYAESMHGLLTRQGQVRTDYRGTCGLASTANVLRQLDVAQASEADVLTRALDLNACRRPKDGHTGGGTNNNDIVRLMQSYNLTASKVNDLSLQNVADCVDRGGAMMMSVIAKYIQDDSSIPDKVPFKRNTDHWVTVTGISRDRITGEIAGVYIQDTGGHNSYSNIFLSADNFNRMRKISDDFTGIAVFK